MNHLLNEEQFLLFIGARRRTEKGAVIPVDGRPCREIELSLIHI